MIIDKATAIKAINQTASFLIVDDDYSKLEWLNGTSPISENEIDAKIIELQNAETEKENVKASAKAKLIAGEALTAEEADTIVL